MKNIDKKLNRLESFLSKYKALSNQAYEMTLSINYIPGIGVIDEVHSIETLADEYKIKAQRVCKYLREHYKDVDCNDDFRKILDAYSFHKESKQLKNI